MNASRIDRNNPTNAKASFAASAASQCPLQAEERSFQASPKTSVPGLRGPHKELNLEIFVADLWITLSVPRNSITFAIGTAILMRGDHFGPVFRPTHRQLFCPTTTPAFGWALA